MARSPHEEQTPRLRAKTSGYFERHARAMRVELLLLALVFLCLEFVLPTILSSQYSKRFFEKHLSDALNYPVTFDHINTHLYGRPMVEVSGMQIRDHQGNLFFHAEGARLDLSLLSLLRGRIALASIDVDGGDFLAARLPDGRWNVADLVGAGNDPDHAIDLERTAITMRQVLVTFRDQALPLPVLQHIRLQDFSISTMDIRRRTHLRLEAIDEDHPQSRLSMKGDFSVFMPNDISSLSGHLEMLLQHFSLAILNPYLHDYKFPVRQCEGFYDLELKADGQGAAPLSVTMSSRIEGLKVAVAAGGNGATARSLVAGRHQDSAAHTAPLTWISLGDAFLAGPFNVATDGMRFAKLRGEVAHTAFELSGGLDHFQSGSPRVETTLSTRDFELVEPMRSVIRVSLDELAQRIFDGVTGTAQVQVKWTGKLSDPTLDWNAELTRAHYHDFEYHFDLNDMSAQLRSEGNRMKIASVRGRFFNAPLDGRGWIDANNRLDATISLSGMPLAQFYPYFQALEDHGTISSASWVDRVPSAGGQAQAKLHLAGSWNNPNITGVINLQRARVALAGLAEPLTDLKGQIVLQGATVLTRQFSGLLGASPFEMTATWNSDDFSIRAMNFDSPKMDLRCYDELVASHWIDAVELPGLGAVQRADGEAAVHLHYESPAARLRRRFSALTGAAMVESAPPPDPEPLSGAASSGLPEFSFRLEGAGAVLSRIALPLKNLDGGISFEKGTLKFDRFRGFVGSSSVSLQGAVEHLDQPERQWDVTLESRLVFPQAAELLPAVWKRQLNARGESAARLAIRGASSTGLHVNGELEFPKNSEWIWANAVQKPAGSTLQFSADGVWKDREFSLNDGKLMLDQLPLLVKGSIAFPEDAPERMAVTLSLPQFAPAVHLVRFIRPPLPDLKIRGGVVSGSLTLSGNPSAPTWTSALRVADLAVTGMPWGATNLTGDLTAGRQGLSANDFLAIINNVPMRVTGRFDLADSNPNMTFAVKNMNLDALASTLARMSAVAEPSGVSAANRPMSIHVSASSGVFFHQPIKHFLAEGKWEDGILRLDPMEVTAGDSASHAVIAWNSLTNEQHMEFDARDVPMGPFLDEVLDLQLPVQGKLSVQANLTSRNPGAQNLFSSFQGKVRFSAANGTLEHAGLPQRLLSMAALVHEGLFGFNLGRIFQTIDPPRFKTFKKFSADVVFLPEGRALLENGEFKSNLFDLNASGAIDTKTEGMNIAVKGSMPEIPRGSNFLAQIFGRISVREFYRNVRDVGLLIAGQRKRIKPRRHSFEFKLTGNVEGIKSIEDFHFTH